MRARRAAVAWSVVVALAAVAPAAAQQAPPKEFGGGGGPAAGASAAARAVGALPAELASFRRSGEVTDFEARPGGAGFGAAARYVPSRGERVVATVYIYDRGLAGLAEGAEGAAAVERELRSTGAELEAMVRNGRYRSAAAEAGLSLGPPSDGGRAAVRCATWRVVQPDGAGTGDAVCVTVHRGAFVKVRLPAWSAPEPTAAAAAAAAAAAGLMAATLAMAVVEARGGGGGGGRSGGKRL